MQVRGHAYLSFGDRWRFQAVLDEAHPEDGWSIYDRGEDCPPPIGAFTVIFGREDWVEIDSGLTVAALEREVERLVPGAGFVTQWRAWQMEARQ